MTDDALSHSTDRSADREQEHEQEREDAAGTPGWAVVGAGTIARRFVSELPFSGGRLVAVGSADPQRAADLAALGAEHGFADVRAGTHQEAISDPEVEAVYVASVNTEHAHLVLAALAAGKAVLCEKPMTPNWGTTMALADAARASGGTLVEAFIHRFHPQTLAALDLVRDGAIGELLHIDASYSFSTDERTGRLYDADLAGGGILDVGVYPLSMAQAIVGATGASTEPVEFTASGELGPTGVDEWSLARVRYARGITATLRTGIRLEERGPVSIYGSRGLIRIPDPWSYAEEQTIEVRVVGEEPRFPTFRTRPYAAEAEATIAAARRAREERERSGSAVAGEAPEIPLADSVSLARTLDQWKAASGVRFPFEREDADIPTVSGRPLAVAADAPMHYGEIPGLGKRMSRLVLGVDNQPDLAQASAIFDHFVERGGTAFDTAWLYGGGEYETRFGRWVRNRGIRDDLVVITKGAHTPYCDPESLSRQLHESLERQGTDYADIYVMHRDNPEVPVGEFVDVMDEHRRAGRIRLYGVSNWALDRVDAANAYARANGRHELSALSNHFGLAEAYDVPWEGCRHVTDPASKEWLVERQLPLLPWSSQARGFFARADPDDRTDAELVRCYYSDENFERLARARRLGAELGVPATAVALAYVLAQPFPTFPLFGPRSIAEARSSMEGLRVELSPEQVAWLDLRG